MLIRQMMTNRIENPLGFDLGEPSLSWIVDDTTAKSQRWARVEVAADPEFKEILMDTGRMRPFPAWMSASISRCIRVHAITGG